MANEDIDTEVLMQARADALYCAVGCLKEEDKIERYMLPYYTEQFLDFILTGKQT